MSDVRRLGSDARPKEVALLLLDVVDVDDGSDDDDDGGGGGSDDADGVIISACSYRYIDGDIVIG
jgi:hypothetical protein